MDAQRNLAGMPGLPLVSADHCLHGLSFADARQYRISIDYSSFWALFRHASVLWPSLIYPYTPRRSFVSTFFKRAAQSSGVVMRIPSGSS
jgi:hypothetical protein